MYESDISGDALMDVIVKLNDYLERQIARHPNPAIYEDVLEKLALLLEENELTLEIDYGED